MQFLWDLSWTTEYTTRKGTVQQATEQNYFLSREWEACRSTLACAQLEPRREEHAHVVTIRLGYGGVIWCAEKTTTLRRTGNRCIGKGIGTC